MSDFRENDIFELLETSFFNRIQLVLAVRLPFQAILTFYAGQPERLQLNSIKHKVHMKCFFFIAEFEIAAKIRKIAVYRFLISLLVPEL